MLILRFFDDSGHGSGGRYRGDTAVTGRTIYERIDFRLLSAGTVIGCGTFRLRNVMHPHLGVAKTVFLQ